MIKITYNTTSKETTKPEKTTVNIFNGKMFVRYSIAGRAKGTVDKMQMDGRKNVLFSRGCMIQIFIGKTEEEILEIAKKDIENGVYVAEQKTGKKLKIENLEVERR